MLKTESPAGPMVSMRTVSSENDLTPAGGPIATSLSNTCPWLTKKIE